MKLDVSSLTDKLLWLSSLKAIYIVCHFWGGGGGGGGGWCHGESACFLMVPGVDYSPVNVD